MSIFLGLLRSSCLSDRPLWVIASRFIQAPKPYGNEHPFRGAELLALLLVNLILLLIAGWLLAGTDLNSSSTKYSRGHRQSMESSSQTRRNRWRDSTKS